MRASTLVLSVAASAVSAQNLASYSEALASLTTDPAYSSLIASIQTADPTSLYEQAASLADSALAEISQQAATATGSEADFLNGLYSSAAAGLSSYDALATSALNMTGTPAATGASPTQTNGGGSSNNNDDPDSDSDGASNSQSASVEAQSGNGAAATAVPVVMGAVGMAVLGML